MMDRRSFLLRTAVVSAGAALAAPRPSIAGDEPRPIAPELVSQFVGKSHTDLEAVRGLLQREPALANAAWDWGNGDWETGLGAASHVGQPDIAKLILDRGARIDVFAATMLGLAGIVKVLLDEIPTIHRVPGPHGIPLLSHAIVGREDTTEVVELLIDRGSDVNAKSFRGVTPLMAAASIGRVEVIDLLLARGADPQLVDSESRTALDWATSRSHEAAVERLSGLQGS